MKFGLLFIAALVFHPPLKGKSTVILPWRAIFKNFSPTKVGGSESLFTPAAEKLRFSFLCRVRTPSADTSLTWAIHPKAWKKVLLRLLYIYMSAPLLAAALNTKIIPASCDKNLHPIH